MNLPLLKSFLLVCNQNPAPGFIILISKEKSNKKNKKESDYVKYFLSMQKYVNVVVGTLLRFASITGCKSTPLAPTFSSNPKKQPKYRKTGGLVPFFH